ncbi:MAG: DUF4149 domain-containing protein [Aquificae bacterium]|nr:DUF4149 domain-containing protein [Aquificota bacterium]
MLSERVSLALLSSFLGIGLFFSFFIAPLLFEELPKELAGRVVERVFPVYFGVGILAVFFTLLFVKKKPVRVLSLLNLIILSVEEFYVLPKAHALKATNYELFLRFHTLSMSLNLLILFLSFVKVLILILKR